jgi:peptidoglycan/LPS O-acetylase OafA/YrhL
MKTDRGAGSKAAAGAGRFVFIDALRGIAAIAVVVHHACAESSLHRAIARAMPSSLLLLLFSGRRGVQVFFVISGFVIAHSLRRTQLNARECGRFILRRQLRLDPPYWAMLTITVLFFAAVRSIPAVLPRPFPGWGTLAANFLYLEKILNLADVLQVGWTLAIEIQFYLAFMCILAIARKPGSGPLAIALLLVTAVAAIPTDPNATYWARWAVNTWPYFVAGALCYWAVARQASHWYLFLVLAALIASCMRFGTQSPVIIGVLTTVAIYWAGRTGRLFTLWNNFPLQFLGRISYSLYLTHLLVVVSVQQLGYLLTGDNRPAALGWYILSILAAIAVAYPFHLLVELPSMRLAGRFKTDAGPSAPSGFAEPLPPVEDMPVAS